jgi:hypothetical protein
VVLWSESPTAYQKFFVSTNLVNKLIQHFQSASPKNPTGIKGYIILILNCIRLSKELEDQVEEIITSVTTDSNNKPNNQIAKFWTNFLQNNTLWINFSKDLEEATLRETKDNYGDMSQHLRSEFAPVQIQTLPSNNGLYPKLHVNISDNKKDTGCEGINLGSQCKLIIIKKKKNIR